MSTFSHPAVACARTRVICWSDELANEIAGLLVEDRVPALERRYAEELLASIEDVLSEAEAWASDAWGDQ